jgi:hypothetical protein
MSVGSESARGDPEWLTGSKNNNISRASFQVCAADRREPWRPRI